MGIYLVQLTGHPIERLREREIFIIDLLITGIFSIAVFIDKHF